MDIHIFHDGEESGPYTEEAVHALLKQGSVQVNDPAWRPGLSEWTPLLDLLHPAVVPSPGAVQVAAKVTAPPAREPATQRQQAFLAYLRIPFTPTITREEASALVNHALENPKDPARLARWNEERLQLHPELFANEAQARKENRPQRYLEICQEEGAPYFEKVTKAHCQVLVAHLDVRFPKWDAFEREAVQKYFFPALAEKFPQLVTSEGKGRFHFAAPTPVIRKTAKHTPVVARALPVAGPSVFGALLRGIVLGLVVLGGLWFGRTYFSKKAPPAKRAAVSPAKSSTGKNVGEVLPKDAATPASTPEGSAAPVAVTDDRRSEPAEAKTSTPEKESGAEAPASMTAGAPPPP